MANKPNPADFSPTVPDFPSIGQYQPIYGKFDLTTYIQGASDYEIMAFLVQCYNATLKGYSDVTQLSKDTVTAYNQLQTWVNTWFDELDVQQEINNKLQSMYEAGTLATAIAQSNTIPTAVAQYLNSTEGTQNLSNVTAQKIEAMASTGALGTVINNTGTVQSTTTNWLQQNVTPTGSAVMIDKSLTINGAAADAKITGNTFKGSYQAYNDSVTDIDDLFKPGSYHLTKESLGEHFSELNLQNSSESGTYYSMLVLAPSTLTNYAIENGQYDVTQVLVLNGIKQSVFIRNSISLKFGKFMEVCSNGARRAFNSNVYPNPTTLDFYDVGIYSPTSSAINGYADEIGTANGWYSLINIAPVETQMSSNVDFHNIYQILVQCGLEGQTVWQRQRYILGATEHKTKWTMLNSDSNPTYRSMFDGLVDVNSLNSKIGTFRVSTDSLLEHKSGIELSDNDIKSYYWTVVSIGQVTEGSYLKFDTSQFLIGVSRNNNGTRYIYYRDSYLLNFNKWTLLYTNVKQPEPTPLHSPQKIFFMGDSFTHDFSGTSYGVISYTRYLELMGNYDCTNEAIDGASATSWYAESGDKITADYDTFFIAFGLNSDPNGLGTMDDGENAETFAGSMQTIIKKIYAVNPTARIIVWCMDAWYAKDKSDMAKHISDKYGCEYHSMKADATIPVRIDGKFHGVIPTLDASYVNTKTLSLCQSESNHHPTSVAQYQLATYLKTII